jgi:hypothetical protein
MTLDAVDMRDSFPGLFGMNSLMLAVVVHDLERAEELSLFNVLHREATIAVGE